MRPTSPSAAHILACTSFVSASGQSPTLLVPRSSPQTRIRCLQTPCYRPAGSSSQRGQSMPLQRRPSASTCRIVRCSYRPNSSHASRALGVIAMGAKRPRRRRDPNRRQAAMSVGRAVVGDWHRGHAKRRSLCVAGALHPFEVARLAATSASRTDARTPASPAECSTGRTPGSRRWLPSWGRGRACAVAQGHSSVRDGAD